MLQLLHQSPKELAVKVTKEGCIYGLTVLLFLAYVTHTDTQTHATDVMTELNICMTKKCCLLDEM